MALSPNTIAITVTYNPDPDVLKKQLENLKGQCNVLIVDNASSQDLRHLIQTMRHANDHLQVIALNENIGISRAQNAGIEYIRQHYPDIFFILFLDHDSIPSKDMVKGLEGDFATLVKTCKNPAALGPLLFDPRDKSYLGFHLQKWGFWLKKIPSKTQMIECQSLNSSGSFISMEALRKVGLFEKNFFMDHGETEWCFRAIAKGYKIFGTAKVVMEHNMGDEVCEYWFFGKKRMPYRTPLRHYYIIRNSILLQKRSYVPLTWKFWNVIKIFFTFFYFGFFAQEAKEHRRCIVRGISDGVKGVTGEAEKLSS